MVGFVGFVVVGGGYGGFVVTGGGSLLGVVGWTFIDFFFPHFNNNITWI